MDELGLCTGTETKGMEIHSNQFDHRCLRIPNTGLCFTITSSVLCTIEDSEIEIGNIESTSTAKLVMAANEMTVDGDDWIGYAGYYTVDHSES